MTWKVSGKYMYVYWIAKCKRLIQVFLRFSDCKTKQQKSRNKDDVSNRVTVVMHLMESV